MKKLITILFVFIINSYSLVGQITLTIEGKTENNTETGIWYGVNIPRDVPTKATYRNNSITSVNSGGYMLQAGDETPGSRNNNLDGQVISGNRFNWNGVNNASIITHGVFVGYNINSVIKYNFLENVPYGIIFKSGKDDGSSMTFTSGGCAYNICKNGKFSVRMKGINGVKVYNNTFYSGDGSGRYLLLITANQDRIIAAPSAATKVFNNIFYSTMKLPLIAIESSCLTNFESDYNIFWCEAGEPFFTIDGKAYTWDQWKALGYDLNSKIVNPNFINTIDFVPASRLDYGKELGTEWQTGLSTSATWIVGTSPSTANQNGKWQVGARIHQPKLVSGIIVTGTNGATSVNSNRGTLQLLAAVQPTDAAIKTVTWSVINETGKASINSSGLLTAEKNGTVKAIATANDGSGVKGELIISISNQIVLVESISIIDNLKDGIISGIGTKIYFNATVTPPDATNKELEWLVENLTGQASMDKSGTLTTLSTGQIKVIVKALDGSNTVNQKEYTITIPVGNRQPDQSQIFKIFPNPTQDKIQIQFDQVPADGIIVELRDIKGQILKKKRVFENIVYWPVIHNSSGTYFITIMYKSESYTEKIVINNDMP